MLNKREEAFKEIQKLIKQAGEFLEGIGLEEPGALEEIIDRIHVAVEEALSEIFNDGTKKKSKDRQLHQSTNPRLQNSAGYIQSQLAKTKALIRKVEKNTREKSYNAEDLYQKIKNALRSIKPAVLPEEKPERIDSLKRDNLLRTIDSLELASIQNPHAKTQVKNKLRRDNRKYIAELLFIDFKGTLQLESPQGTSEETRKIIAEEITKSIPLGKKLTQDEKILFEDTINEILYERNPDRMEIPQPADWPKNLDHSIAVMFQSWKDRKQNPRIKDLLEKHEFRNEKADNEKRIDEILKELGYSLWKDLFEIETETNAGVVITARLKVKKALTENLRTKFTGDGPQKILDTIKDRAKVNSFPLEKVLTLGEIQEIKKHL